MACGTEQMADLKAAEWIPLLKSVHLLAPKFGGDVQAKELILSRFRDGALRSRAHFYVQEADIGPVNFRRYLDSWSGWPDQTRPESYPRMLAECYVRASSDKDSYLVVPHNFFSNFKTWHIDSSSISWARGQIILRRPANFKRKGKRQLLVTPADVEGIDEKSAFVRRIVSGLQVRLDDILAIIQPDVSFGISRANDGCAIAAPTLPDDWKPRDFPNLELAHKVAELLRSGEARIRSVAFRAVIGDVIGADSKIHSLRITYDKLYDPEGMPHQKKMIFIDTTTP